MKSLHSQNIMHRDLKWGNVLLNRKGVVKITDFDSAKEDPQSWKMNIQPHTQLEVGTLEFQAPEILNSDGKYGIEVDVYSFGIMIYALVYEMNNPFFASYYGGGGGGGGITTTTINNPPQQEEEEKEEEYFCSCGTEIGKNMMSNIQNPMTLLQHVSKCDLRPLIRRKKKNNDDDDDDQLLSLEDRLIELAVLCWDGDPRKRPTFSTIVKFFENEVLKSEKQKFCYSIVQIRVFDEKEEEEDIKRRRRRPYFCMKILLMKPTMKKLRKLVEKKLQSLEEEEEEEEFQYFYYFQQEEKKKKKKMESDEDVLEMISMDQNPEVLVTKLNLNSSKRRRRLSVVVDDEDVSNNNKKEEKNPNIFVEEQQQEESDPEIEKLKKDIIELKEKNIRIMGEKENTELRYANLRSKIEQVVKDLVSKEEGEEEKESIDGVLLDRLSQILFEDLTSSVD